MFLNNNSLIMQWNVDENDNPVSVHIPREVQQVSPTHGVVQLVQVPDQHQRIKMVTEDNLQLHEVFNVEDIVEDSFYVDYGVGIVRFHNSLHGKIVLISYYGRGVILISDSRIFHKDGENVTDTWDNILERSQDALDLIESAGGLVEAMKKIDEKVEEGNKVADRIEDLITDTQFYGYTISLSREAFVVKAKEDGEVGKNEVSTVYSDVIVYKGAKQIAPTLSIEQEYGCTFEVTGQRVQLTSIDINVIKASAVLNIDCGDGLIAQRKLEVTKVFDGVSQYVVEMTNPFYSFEANSGNAIEVEQSVDCDLTVTKANTSYTNYTITVQNAPSGLRYTIKPEGVTFTCARGSSLPSTGSCLVVVTIDGASFNKTFTWNKTKRGEDAKSLTLVGGQILRYDTPDYSGIPSPSKTTITAKVVGLSGSPKWYVKNNDTWSLIEGQSGVELSFQHNDVKVWGDKKETTIKCELDGYEDELTIVKLATGVSGSDAISVVLTNESHTLAIDNSGVVHETEIARATTKVIAYKGAIEVVPELSKGVCVGCDIAFSDGIVKLLTLDNSFTTATAEINATIDGITITKVWSISKAKQGTNGSVGENGKSYIVNVTDGTRSFTYSQINLDPRPATSTTFVGTLYEDGAEVVEDVSYYWVANGHLSGSSISNTFTPTIATVFDESIINNDIQLTVSYKGNTIVQTVPISITKDANSLDWVQEWNDTKTDIRGNLILTPKLFAGTYDQENDLVTGVAMGKDVLNDGATVGVVGYQNNKATFLLDTDGTVMVGNPFEVGSTGMFFDGNTFTLKANQLSIEGVEVPTVDDVNSKVQQSLNEAKEEIRAEISDVVGQVNELDSYINNALKDGILDEVEKSELALLHRTLGLEMDDVSAQFVAIINNPYFKNTSIMEALNTNYDLYVAKFNDVTTILNKILESETIVGEDVELFNLSLFALKEVSNVLYQTMNDAMTSIAETQSTIIVEQAKEEIKKEIDGVSGSLTDLENTMNGDFKTGLINNINLTNLRNKLSQLETEKSDVDGQYKALVENSKLGATTRTELANAKSELDTAHDQLAAKINSAISDMLMTEEELAEINRLISIYVAKLGLYSEVAQKANSDIALNSAQGAVDALDQEAIFNKLTNNGEKQGIYLQDGKIYVSGEYVHTRNFKAVRDDLTETFKIDNEGDVHIKAKSFYLTGDDTNIADKDYVDNAIENVSIGNVNVMLSNEAQVIATSNTRVPLSNQSFSTTVKMYMGTKEVTDFTIGTIASANGIIVSVSPLTKVVTFTVKTDTAITVDSGTFTIPVISNGKTFNKEWSWAVSKQGNNGSNGSNGSDGSDGQDAKHVIVNGEQVFKYTNNFTGTPTPSNITLTVTKVNTTETGKWQYKNASGVWTDWKVGETVQTGTTLLVSPTSYNLATEKVMSIRYIIGSIYDEITLVKVTDGTNGTNGTNGKDAQYVLLNGEQVFKYSNNFSGTPTPSSIALTSTTFNISSPTRVWEFKRSGEEAWNPITSATSSNSETFVLDANNSTIFNSGDVKSVTIRCKVGSVHDEITIVKVSDGTNGTNGKDGIDGAKGQDGVSTYFYVRYSANSDGSSMTNSPTTSTKYMGTASTTSNTAPTTPSSYTWTLIKGADGEKGSQGAKGEDGRSSYLHVKYSDDGKTFTSNNGETIGKYIGTYVDYTEADSNVFSAYTWKKFVGEDGSDGTDGVNGQDAYTVILSNESHTFPSDSKGNIATALSVTTTAIGFKGVTSITPTIGTLPTVTGLTLSKSGAVVTIQANTGASLADMGTFTIPVFIDGKTFNKVFSWTKTKAGANGTNGANGTSITSVDTEYYLSTSSTSLAGGSWSTDAPKWENGKYMWSRMKTTYSTGSTTYSQPVCITGQQGQNGSAGTGISSITEEYYLSTSKTTQTGGSWVTTPPTWKINTYLWTRSKIVYTNPSSTVYTTPVCDSSWEAINDIEVATRNYIYYGKGDSKLGYFKNASKIENGYAEYSLTSMGSHHSISIADGFVLGVRDYEVGRTVTYSYDIMYTVWDFPTGSNRGEFWMGQRYTTRADGQTVGGEWKGVTTKDLPIVGENGVELNKWHHVSKTFTIPAQAGEGVRDESALKLYNSSTSVRANVTLRLKNVKLAYGNKETDFTESPEEIQNEINNTVSNVDVMYYLSTSKTSLTGGSWVTVAPEWVDGKFMWQKTVTTLKGGSVIESSPTCIAGATGSSGADGKGVKSIVEQYYHSTSMTSMTGGSWVDKVPTPVAGKYIWTRSIITYTDNSTTTTDGVCSTGATGSKGDKGDTGASGTNGQDAITVVLSNETHSFPCENNGNIPTALTTTCTVTAYKGATSVTPTIGTITNPSGMTITKSGTTITIQANTGTSLADTGSVNIPITVDGKSFTKTFSWSKAKKGANGSNGSNGADAKTVDILASSQVFKSTDGGKTFAPSTITLTPTLQNVTYSNWQYSVNGGTTWATVVSGLNGLTISGSVLTISKDSALFTSSVTSVVFRVNTSVSTVYDTMTVVKLYDVVEMTQEDIFNKLTNNGQTQGIYLENSKLYLNGEYMKAKSLTADKLHADVLSANSIVSIINGGSTTINGGKITTNSITADKINTKTLTADMITSGTFKGTNFEAGGSGNNGLFLAKDSSNNVVFSASNNGVYATNVTFVDTVNFDGTFKTSKTSTINSNGLVFSESELSSTYNYTTAARVGDNGFSVSSTLTSGGSTSTSSTTITDSKIETTGTIKATGQVTSLSSIRGTGFSQSDYSIVNEFGQNIDMHFAGSTNDYDARLQTGTGRNLSIKVPGANVYIDHPDSGRTLRFGINSNNVFIQNVAGKQALTMEDSGRLSYDGYTVPHNWRQSFTPFLYCDTGSFTARGSYGQAIYLGDLVFVQGRVIATRGSLTGSLAIGGLPVSNIQNYAPVTFGFFGGLYTGHPTTSVDVHGYVQQNAGHIVLNHTDRNRGGWYPLHAEYGQTGEWDITFSAVYRWR